MSEHKTFSCDECSEEISAGVTLNRFGAVPSGVATVDGPLHFCSIYCLREWAQRAFVVGPKLEAHAERLHPHGRLSDDRLRGLVVD